MHLERRAYAGYFLSEMGRAMRGNAVRTLAGVVLLSVLDTLSTLSGDFAHIANAGTWLATLVFQYEISFAALAFYGFEPVRRRWMWRLLGLNIVSSVGILVGLVLLVVPGLHAMVRWSLSVPAMIAEGTGVGDALTRSGEEVTGRFWPIAGTFLVIWSVMAAVAILMAAIPADFTLLGEIVGGLCFNFALVAGWYAAVVIYAAGRDDPHIAEVFA